VQDIPVQLRARNRRQLRQHQFQIAQRNPALARTDPPPPPRQSVTCPVQPALRQTAEQSREQVE